MLINIMVFVSLFFLKHFSPACNGDDLNVSTYGYCLITKRVITKLIIIKQLYFKVTTSGDMNV